VAAIGWRNEVLEADLTVTRVDWTLPDPDSDE
jgi:hypothetical protein